MVTQSLEPAEGFGGRDRKKGSEECPLWGANISSVADVKKGFSILSWHCLSQLGHKVLGLDAEAFRFEAAIGAVPNLSEGGKSGGDACC